MFSIVTLKASLVQWLEFLPSKQVARVRFPDDAPFLSQRAVCSVCVIGSSLLFIRVRHWFSGKILRCQRSAPGSIPGWRILLSWRSWQRVGLIIPRSPVRPRSKAFFCGSTIAFVAEWSKALDSSSSPFCGRGFESHRKHYFLKFP